MLVKRIIAILFYLFTVVSKSLTNSVAFEHRPKEGQRATDGNTQGNNIIGKSQQKDPKVYLLSTVSNNK